MVRMEAVDIVAVDSNGRVWHSDEVVIWYGPSYILNGEEVPEEWEMVCPATRRCVEHFGKREEVEEYAKEHNLIIVEWMDD